MMTQGHLCGSFFLPFWQTALLGSINSRPSSLPAIPYAPAILIHREWKLDPGTGGNSLPMLLTSELWIRSRVMILSWCTPGTESWGRRTYRWRSAWATSDPQNQSQNRGGEDKREEEKQGQEQEEDWLGPLLGKRCLTVVEVWHGPQLAQLCGLELV